MRVAAKEWRGKVFALRHDLQQLRLLAIILSMQDSRDATSFNFTSQHFACISFFSSTP